MKYVSPSRECPENKRIIEREKYNLVFVGYTLMDELTNKWVPVYVRRRKEIKK